MSTIEPLTIKTGADWGWTYSITFPNGSQPVIAAPVMEIRRDVSTSGQLIARLDTTGEADGLIEILGPGSLRLSMTHQVTARLAYGRGFWDIFGLIEDELVPLASGAINIEPHVTIYAGA